jgi:UDP-3-O-[3-hydroxymyristoyl] glucosamine N-acyltransferase
MLDSDEHTEGSMNAASTRRQLSASEIAEILSGEVIGDPAIIIDDLDVIERATGTHLSFVGDLKNLSRVRNSRSRVIVVPETVRAELAKYSDRTFILVPEAEMAFLSIAAILRPHRSRTFTGISDRAVVDSTAIIGANTNIHPLAMIGRDVVIGHSCDIQPGVVIGDGCRLGNNVALYANTVLYNDIVIEDHVTIHASCVIGADGFGYRFVNGGHQHIPHYGTVRICSDVEIGASTTIDRAKVGETVIGSGTRIDNQVMIGHNCQIGRHNLLVSQVGLAGSVTTGDYVVCAGQVGVADHVHLGDGAVVGAQAGVNRDMPGGQTYLGNPAGPMAETSKQLAAIRRLPEMRDTIKRMNKELEVLRARLSSDRDTDAESAAA